MLTSDQKLGEPMQTGFQMPPELSSLEEKWLVEQWLISAGVVSDSAIDTLLMYAYAQKGVVNVKIEIKNDEEERAQGIKYKIKLEPKVKLKFLALKKAEKIKNPILRKATLLALVKSGVPFDLEKNVLRLAEEYLPKNFSVEVEIV